MNQSNSNPATLKIVLYGDIILPNEYRLRAKANFPISVACLSDKSTEAEKEAAF